MSAPHHGDGKQSEAMQRFIDQVERRAKREYTNGRLGASDDGSLAMAVAADPARGLVRVDFGKPVEWFALPAQQAVALAQLLIEKAKQASREPLSIVIG